MCTSILKLAIFIVACFSVASGQVLMPGSCVNHSVVQNFDVSLYLGTWYEIENTFTNFEVNGTCVSAIYSDFGNGTIRVNNTQINSDGVGQFTLGKARLEDPSQKEGKLLVNFPQMGEIEAPYWILDTDYTNYSIVWSCRNAQDNLHSLQTMWFLARTRIASQYFRGYVRGYLKGIDFDVSYLEETEQTNCFNNKNDAEDELDDVYQIV